MTTGTASPGERAPTPTRLRSDKALLRRAVGPVFAGPLADPHRLSRRLRLLAVAVRWVTIGLGLLVGALRDPVDVAFLASAAALIGLAFLLITRPLHLDPPDQRSLVAIGVELAVTVAAVAVTGGLKSPFVLTPMVPVVLAGYVYAPGRRMAIGISAAGMLAAAAVIATERSDPASQRSAAEIAVVFLLSGVIGAFARVLVSDTMAQQEAVVDQVARLETANELLVALHGVARTLPASLDLGEVLVSIRSRLRPLIDCTSLAVFVHDEVGGAWLVELAEGVRLPAQFTTEALPSALRPVVLDTSRPLAEGDLLISDVQGCSPLARSGLYAPLRARGSVVGLLAMEHTVPHKYGPQQVELLANLAGLFGLSIDNALWFGRLRRFGAEAERARIARDLHDRIAQSLAYVAFELERLAGREGDQEIEALHAVVRDVVGDLREMLYQLRASVSEEADLETVAQQYLARFEERTGIRVDWRSRVMRRLPYQVEQELWRIMQEALTNVERHSGTRAVRVRWDVDGRGARLEVADPGRGFEPEVVAGDRYGLVGMSERADAIGARLEVDSRRGEGTTVTVTLESTG